MEKIYECIPQNDLDCYYNSEWKKNHAKSELNNNFAILQEEIDNNFYEFINKATIVDNDNILNQLIVFRDSYYNRKNYSAYIIEMVKHIKSIDSISDLTKIIKLMSKLQIPSLIDLGVVSNFKSPDVYTLGIDGVNLSLVDKKYYNSSHPEKIKIFEEVLISVYRFIKKFWSYDISDMPTFVSNIIIFEIVVSQYLLDKEEYNDPIKTNNSMKYNDFIEKYDVDNFWQNVLQNIVTEETIIYYSNPKYFDFIKKYIQFISANGMTMVKDYLVYCMIIKYGIFTSLRKDLFKLSPDRPKEEYIVFTKLFYETFGYYLEDIYEKVCSNKEKNKLVRDIFNEMKSYCITVFKQTTMFKEQTKNEAIKKLERLDIIVGRQKYHIDLNELAPLGNNFFDNLMTIDFFYFQKKMEKLDKPVVREYLSLENDTFSFLINAYYHPVRNIIYVPTAITNNLFVKVDGDPIYNYGGIGIIMAHEIMHSFDSEGAQYDYLGHLNNWWSEEDYAKFDSEVKKVINHYSMFELYGLPINATYSVPENFADIIGLKLSFRTYIKKYLGKTKNFTIEEKEHLKLFFKRWAVILRNIEDKKLLEYAINFDIHSPFIIRVNGPAAHLSEFYEIYDVKPDHQNYLEPELRTKFFDLN